MIPKGKTRASADLVAQPLETLCFVLPFLLFYEGVSLWAGATRLGRTTERVAAFELMRIFFEVLGASATMLPALTVIAILLATHLVSRRRWHVRKKAVGMMFLESAVWALPLMLLARSVRTLAAGDAAPQWLVQLALGIGAGIYEELVFRLILVTVLVIIGADLLHFAPSRVLAASVVISAVAFALHHHPPIGTEPFDGARFAFRCFAGLYLGTIFALRGYGPAAGAHIAYNIMALW